MIIPLTNPGGQITLWVRSEGSISPRVAVAWRVLRGGVVIHEETAEPGTLTRVAHQIVDAEAPAGAVTYVVEASGVALSVACVFQ